MREDKYISKRLTALLWEVRDWERTLPLIIRDIKCKKVKPKNTKQPALWISSQAITKRNQQYIGRSHGAGSNRLCKKSSVLIFKMLEIQLTTLYF